MFDLVIKNATIVDGTGNTPYLSSVGIKDGKIAKIASDLTGEKEIDATGLTLTPGFIDSHSHSDRTTFVCPDQKEKIEQGITYAITGQCGFSSAPSFSKKENRIITVEEFLVKASDEKQGSNSSMLIGHGALRSAVMGNVNKKASAEELEQMKNLLRNGIRAGAKGLSFGLIYVPGCYSDTYECIELAKVVKEEGGILASHIRDENDFVIEAVEEYLEIIKSSGARAVFSHHKSAGVKNWGKVRKTIKMIEDAISEGYDIYFDVYPYIASGTTLSTTFISRQFHPLGCDNVVKLLDDSEIVSKLKAWAKEKWGESYSWILIRDCVGHKEYEGKTLDEVSAMLGTANGFDAGLELIKMANGGVTACFFSMCEDDVEFLLKHPRGMVCTDSAVIVNNQRCHPRLVGTFPRVLGNYVREKSVTSLPEMIRKITSLPAHVYSLKNKGLIKEGYDADICIFDYKIIKDNATYIDCHLKNQGLNYVILNGQIVVENNIYNGIKAGKVYAK